MTGPGLTGGTGRRDPRFPAMLRRRSNLILALLAALPVAAILGVQLGQSAIAEINPVHFRGAAARARGIDADAARPVPDAYALAYGWNEGYDARAMDCGGDCAARRTREAMVFGLDKPAPAAPAREPYWRDATPTSEPAAWAPGETGGRPPGVERYMHYPVEDEAEAKAPSGEEESAEDE